MADGIRATPYRSSFAGSANDILGGLLGYMRDPRRTQQMQGLAGLLESTGIPKTVERLAYGEPLTNIRQANVPTLRPETANALLTLLPVPGGASKAAKAIDPAVQKYGPRLEQSLLPAFEAAYNRGGLTREMVEAMGTGVQSPLTVYHGSPAKFSKFDPTKIGSGEGAQAFGYGHYVAEAPETAQQYKEMLKSKQFSKIVQKDRNVYDVVAPDGTVISEGTLLGKAHKAKDAYDANVGSVYEIDLPDEQIAKMLDYDKPLSKQPNVMAALNKVAENNVKAKVRDDIENEIRMSGVLPVDEAGDDYMSLLFGQSDETIAKANQILKQLTDEKMAKIDFAPLIKNELEGMKPATMTWDATGKDFYEMLAKRRGSPENASAMFKEQGIPGIRYFDQGSRGTGEGTSNFVVFPGNEDLLTILKRNGGLLD